MGRLKIYLGYDPREELAYEVAEYSIQRHSKEPVDIIKLSLDSVSNILTRPIETIMNEDNGVEQLWCPISSAPMSTEFAISRFCVPFLQKTGWALFADSDIVLLDDISKLFDLLDDKYAVMVVKHKHEPTEQYHDAGRLQTFYKRKNWSSVVLWNCSHPSHKKFGLHELNKLAGRDLHSFYWLKDEEIGELSQEWNFLVGVNEGKLEDQKLLHYTNGTPAFDGYEKQHTDYVWDKELEKLNEWKSKYIPFKEKWDKRRTVFIKEKTE